MNVCVAHTKCGFIHYFNLCKCVAKVNEVMGMVNEIPVTPRMETMEDTSYQPNVFIYHMSCSKFGLKRS